MYTVIQDVCTFTDWCNNIHMITCPVLFQVNSLSNICTTLP